MFEQGDDVQGTCRCRRRPQTSHLTRRIADTGGGHAHLIKAIVARYHDVTGVLVELPQVANEVQLSSRLDVVAGDFFTVPLPRCDAYCS